MRWVKGQSGNPKGRAKTGDTLVDRLSKAICAVEKEKGIDLLTHLVRQAYEDNKVLLAVVDKFIPNAKQTQDVIVTSDSVLSLSKVVKELQEHEPGTETT